MSDELRAQLRAALADRDQWRRKARLLESYIGGERFALEDVAREFGVDLDEGEPDR